MTVYFGRGRFADAVPDYFAAATAPDNSTPAPDSSTPAPDQPFVPIAPGGGTVNTDSQYANTSDPYAPDTQYHPNPPPERIPETSSNSGGSSWLSSIADIFKATAQGAGSVAQLVNVHGQPAYPPGYMPPPPPPATPVWLIPAAVVGGGLLLLVVLKKSRKSSVAGYRRKSRRSRR